MSVIGTLEFDFVLLPWQYTVSLSPLIKQYKEVTDIFSSGTNNKIGFLSIDFQTESHSDGTIGGQSVHTYSLPEGSFQVEYLLKNITPDGKCLQSNISNHGTIISGSGDFLGAIGIATTSVTDTPLRHVKVDFYDKAVYPFTN